MGMRCQFWKMKNVLEMDGGDGLDNNMKVCQCTVHLKMVKTVYFMLCVFYQIKTWKTLIILIRNNLKSLQVDIFWILKT